ncbi:hypothetical protein AAFF_G00190220 [Aldrovandia affinis]|uniref:Uncharacterized protein n=1 Tax=Aldrovandia affinis TaxID=143900 RepID=A0AAD7RJD2_9TELE|nr:hypothetical protein AAFF_G00190220 [Aldrovandia affinis]
MDMQQRSASLAFLPLRLQFHLTDKPAAAAAASERAPRSAPAPEIHLPHSASALRPAAGKNINSDPARAGRLSLQRLGVDAREEESVRGVRRTGRRGESPLGDGPQGWETAPGTWS